MKYTKEVLQEAILVSKNYCDIARYFGIVPHGGSVSRFKQLAIKYNIDVSHFEKKYEQLSLIAKKRKKSATEILVYRKNAIYKEHGYKLKRALLEIGREYKCELCENLGTWNDKELKLQVDHKDGDINNCSPENLRFLCPNCHSQTENFMYNNRGKQYFCKNCAKRLHGKTKTGLCQHCWLTHKNEYVIKK